jgi:hypothetical protein
MRLLVAVLVVVGCGSSTKSPTIDAAPAGHPDAAPGTPDGSSVDAAPMGIWHPAPGTTWQWQLTGTIDTSIDVAMYDIDLFTTPQSTIDGLHADGRIVICYLSAGTYEPDRPDSTSFPAAALGNVLPDWPDERWLDTRDATVRMIMKARLDTAVSKHCDGVEPDNVDGYANNPGFPLTASTQLDYDGFLATEAHARGLSVGLKNDLDQVVDLVGQFDWALNEQCEQYTECSTLQPFLDASKAVFHVEYGDMSILAMTCANSPPGFSTLVKDLNLDAFRLACP